MESRIGLPGISNVGTESRAGAQSSWGTRTETLSEFPEVGEEPFAMSTATNVLPDGTFPTSVESPYLENAWLLSSPILFQEEDQDDSVTTLKDDVLDPSRWLELEI